ncbi:NADPH-dependent FMN reductase [Candidatus Woesearchaeota archaeon]|nr:NADPH-dependent FMN reductase [Candidatus Woesearchaeota archaeon]
MLYIPIILGTARRGRQSEKAAKYMLEKVKKAKIKTGFLDVRDYRIRATDNTQKIPKAQKLGPKIKRADGVIIVSPEYNHGYPGELKMMMDMLYKQFHNKPVGICGVSAGGLGGARMVQMLRQVCIAFHMVPINSAVYFSNIQDLFDSKGNIKDKTYHERAEGFLDELVMYAKKLR